MKTTIFISLYFLIIIAISVCLLLISNSEYQELSLVGKEYENLKEQSDKLIKELDSLEFEIQQYKIIKGIEYNNEYFKRIKYLNNRIKINR